MSRLPHITENLILHITGALDSLDPSFFTWAEEIEAQEAWAEERGAQEASTETSAPADTVASTSEDSSTAEIEPTARKKQTARDKLREFESKGHGTVSYVACLEAIQKEFDYRDQLLDLPGGKNIHHFNWYGEPVYQSSRTPPEISLWYMTTPPRFGLISSSDIFREVTTKHNAEKWIDPIVIRVNNGVYLPQDADGLLRFAKSRTQKMYTPHGCWRSDRKDRQIFLDEGEPLVYMETNMRVGNGFIEGTPIRTRTKWLQYGQLLNAVGLEDLKIAEKRKEIPAWYRRAHASEFRSPSPLSQSMTSDDFEGDYENTGNAVHDGDTTAWVAADDVEITPAQPTCSNRPASIFTILLISRGQDCNSLKPGWSAIKR
ncbi:hypothetical protein BJX65DRAFT_303731 [Aspergillus insuetus]